MLEPGNRALIFDILRPPEGFALDFAIGTTFTLDLLTLLTAPVAFTLFEAEDESEVLNAGSLPLLEGLRRFADRMVVFCQSGQIKVPSVEFPHFGFLEGAVVQCRTESRTGLFHPKVWVLRYEKEGETLYRVACLTRNLTFDRCWDTVVTLEGSPGAKPAGQGNGLVEFVRALPRLGAGLDAARGTRIEQIASELERVAFEPPPGFDAVAFHPLGLSPSGRLPFERLRGRMLVVSPFVGEKGLRRIVSGRSGCMLVTRPETLQEGECRAPEIEKYFVLAEQAAGEPEDGELPASRGLHAKCYVVDDGRSAHVFTGSANATEAGFGRNVEMLVQLTGKSKLCGIDALLSKADGETGFVDLLRQEEPPAMPPPPDTEAESARATIENVRAIFGAHVFEGVVSKAAAADAYRLEIDVHAATSALPADVRIDVWPVTLRRGLGCRVEASQPSVVFDGLSLESLSGFLAVLVEVPAGSRRFSEQFVVSVALSDVPADRRDRLMRWVLRDRKRVVQFLLFLLADDGVSPDGGAGTTDRGGRSGGSEDRAGDASPGLLEVLLRALQREPARIDRVAEALTSIRSGSDGARDNLLPDGFDDVWKAVWGARERSREWQTK
jgi:hypothetical protein